MSWWDPFVSLFTGGSGSVEDLGSVGDSVGNTVADFAGMDAGNGLDEFGSAASDYGGAGTGAVSAGLQLGYDPSAQQKWNQNYSTPGYDASAQQKAMQAATPGVSMGAPDPYQGLTNVAEQGNAAPVAGTDLTTGLTNGVKKVGKYLTDNPGLVTAGLNTLNAGLMNTGVPSAFKQAVGVQAEGNQSNKDTAAAKTAVGTSMVGQAPFLANNALTGSMNSNAANEQATIRGLNQQGYKPGDAQYDSALAAGRTAASQNNGTAWAQGQGQMANQEATGAGLMTAYRPDTSAYSSLGNAEQKSQESENSQGTALAANAGNAFNIYAGKQATPAPKAKTNPDGTPVVPT